jgi:prepilin-type processing-associated H-X9-DG protein
MIFMDSVSSVLGPDYFYDPGFFRWDHNGRAGVLYVDGHADLRHRKEISPRVVPSPGYVTAHWPAGYANFWLGRPDVVLPYLY